MGKRKNTIEIKEYYAITNNFKENNYGVGWYFNP